MKVLWLSNCILSDSGITTSGSWLFAMSEALVNCGQIELYNMTFSKTIKSIVQEDTKILKQWVVPINEMQKLPNKDTIQNIHDIIQYINPDIIHIWGTESFWALIFSRGYINRKYILEIQGLKSACAQVFYGGMSFTDLLDCIRIREIIFPSHSLIAQKKIFSAWKRSEIEMISKSSFISVQSRWTKAQIIPYTSLDTHILMTLRPIRSSFLESKPWYPKSTFNIFTLSSSADSYKGFHIVIKALAIVKIKYPNIKLKVVGNIIKTRKYNFLRPGYVRFLLDLINDLGLKENIDFLGPKNASEIIDIMYDCDCSVQSSFVESYSAFLAESMAVGIPSVVAFSGAMPELAENNITALFYTPTDYVQCADKIMNLIENPDLARKISINSRTKAQNRNNIEAVVKRQLEIYNDFLKF